MMLRTLAGSALTLAMISPALAQMTPTRPTPTLAIGDKAPELKDVEWLRGEPISGWQDGQVYVLDFWATWCGPCIAAMPHVQKLHEEYQDKGVNFIGVSIWPRPNQTPTDEWLATRGENYTYRFAEDNDEGVNANAFMRASGQGGIPTVMIIDQSGKLAWIGHPMADMDESLAKIVAGEWDAEAYAKEKAEREARQRELMAKSRPIMERLQSAFYAENWSEMAKAIDELLELDSETFAQYSLHKYMALIKDNNTQGAAEWGNKVLTQLYPDNTQLLNWFAWAIVDPETEMEPEQRDNRLAVRFAERANTLAEGKDADVLDTLAMAYYSSGNRAKAIETQKKAVELATDPGMKEMFESRLVRYESEQKPE